MLSVFLNSGLARFPRVYRTEIEPRVIAVGISPVTLILFPVLVAVTLPIVQPV